MSIQNFLDLCGWLHDPKKVEAVQSTLPHPVFGASAGVIKGSGKNKTVLLYSFVQKILGNYNVRTQAIGDCVSFAAAGAVDLLKATEIVLKGDFEEWVAETSTEDIYGGSRVNIGHGEIGYDDGSYGAWAAKYVSEIGTLIRKDYGSIDLTRYSGNRARELGKPENGLSNDIVNFAREHKVLTVSQINTYEECRDAIANGYPVTICSNQGFSAVRDSDGFASPEGEWPHAMLIGAVDDNSHRPGVCVINSWGRWNSGPKRFDQPDGSFWVDADVLEQNILSMGDSWSYSNFDGYQIQEINLRII